MSAMPENAPAALAVGDPFMFQDVYRDRTSDHVARDFGPPFAKALFELPIGSWSGPIESGYGWHLIFVESLEPERIPDYDEVAGDVRTQWIADQSERAKQKAYASMRAKYVIVLPELPKAEAPQP
jgi:peptidyl-prolyl cis-trans isomerase C